MINFSWAGITRWEWADSSPVFSVFTVLFFSPDEGALIEVNKKCHSYKLQTLLPLINQDMFAAGKEFGQTHEILTTSPGL